MQQNQKRRAKLVEAEHGDSLTKKERVKLSDHFTYGKLFRFTLPSIIMTIFESAYTIVDGFFVSNFAGSTALAAVNLIFPPLGTRWPQISFSVVDLPLPFSPMKP